MAGSEDQLLVWISLKINKLDIVELKQKKKKKKEKTDKGLTVHVGLRVK